MDSLYSLNQDCKQSEDRMCSEASRRWGMFAKLKSSSGLDFRCVVIWGKICMALVRSYVWFGFLFFPCFNFSVIFQVLLILNIEMRQRQERAATLTYIGIF